MVPIHSHLAAVTRRTSQPARSAQNRPPLAWGPGRVRNPWRERELFATVAAHDYGASVLDCGGPPPLWNSAPPANQTNEESPRTISCEIWDERGDGQDEPGAKAPEGWRTPRSKATPCSRWGGTQSILCVLLFVLAAVVSPAADYEAQFNQWFEVQTNLQSWAGDFTQTRTLTVLNRPLTTTGKVWVKRGEFRWELGQPAQTIVLRLPDQLLIIYPRLKRAEKYPLDAVPTGPMKDALALLDASLPRDRASMEEHFRLVSAAQTNSVLQMTLQPRSEAARKLISQVIIGFHTNDFIIASTTMKFGDGSILQNAFTNIVLNQPLPPDLFEVNLPADYTISEPLKP